MRCRSLLLHAGLVAVLAICLSTAPLYAADKSSSVKSSCNIAYCDIPNDADADSHRLDVYRPKGKDKCPVLFFLHGGAWCSGCKDKVLSVFGYGTIAESFASRGIVVVIPNYRLSPHVKHPEHIKDVAKAFAWTWEHIADYGGDPDRLFVGGHSAGGHLAALLATDPEWLEAEGRSVKNIQGVIGISGVYSLDDVNYDCKWSLSGPRDCFKCQGEVQPLSAIFGRGDEVIKQASPITHVRAGLPPFLLLTGGLDFCPMKRTAKKFASALKDAGCDVESKSISWRTHDTLLFDIVHRTADKKMSRAVVDFINDR